MKNRTFMSALVVAVFSAGCRQATPAMASGSGGTGAAAAGAAAGGSAGGLQTVAIKDPSLNNMTAFSVVIPAGWHFQGTLYQGGNCVQMPSSVSRSTSPDGLSAVEQLPPYGWVWGAGAAAKSASDCIPVSGAMSAEQFLHYLAKSMNLSVTGDDPKAATVNAQAQAQHQPPGQTVAVVGAFVATQNGSFAIKGELTARVTCMEARTAASDVHKCTAYPAYSYAPENEFDAVAKLWQQPGMGGHGAEKDWFQAYLNRSNEQSKAMIAQGEAMSQARNQQASAQFSQLQAKAQQFQADQQVRQHMHDQFLGAMQSSTNSSMANAAASMNARSTAASNIVDYALDRQTVVDPASGQVSKVSSAYTSTWINSAGKTSYQTNDVNANPNGVLPGTWTQQKVVNGNGTPK